MTDVFFMIGIPGSGKSTWISKNLGLDYPIVSRDLIREELGYCKNGEKTKGTEEQEEQVTELQMSRIKKYLKLGQPFVIDNTNLSKYTKKLVEDVKRMNGNPIAVILRTPLSICYKRRRGQIPYDVLRKFQDQLNHVDLSPYSYVMDVTAA